MNPEITLLVHNIRSTHNVGAIFRTAEGFGVKKIILSGYTPYPELSLCSKAPACALVDGEIRSEDPRLPHIREKITSQIHKTALGAESLVPFEFYEDINDWIKENQRTENLPIIALEQSKDSVMLSEFQPPEKFALLLGEEVYGITPELHCRNPNVRQKRIIQRVGRYRNCAIWTNFPEDEMISITNK